MEVGRMRRFIWIALLAFGATMLAVGPAGADDDDGGVGTWRVTITNLTPSGPGAPGSQPLSPPLFAVHSGKADVWSVGEIAGHGVAAIAEDANNAVLESALPQLSGVRTVFTGAGGPIPSGTSRSFTVETDRGETRSTMAYDAGSEKNNERASHIPGPCCGNAFVRDPEGQLIRHHDGITGVGDLDPALYDWQDPVARIAIERIS
jgi:hypothetical protein